MCINPMYAIKLGDKYKFVSAVTDSCLKDSKYLFSTVGKYKILPCGQCYQCRLERSRDWACRCILEAQMHKENCFVTLTYDDAHLPSDYGLQKKDLTNFFKRLRYNTGAKLRYFACGEYGDLYSRPHYHICIFGYRPDDLVLLFRNRAGINLYVSEEISRAWQHRGLVSVGDVTFESAAYVARYVMKKVTGDCAEEHYQGREPEYVVMSRRPGIAASWFEKYSEDVYPNDYLVVRDSIKCKPPRYFDSLYDVYYGEGAIESIKAEREVKSIRKFNRNLDEFTLSRMITKARVCQLKGKQLKRSLDERC